MSSRGRAWQWLPGIKTRRVRRGRKGDGQAVGSDLITAAVRDVLQVLTSDTDVTRRRCWPGCFLLTQQVPCQGQIGSGPNWRIGHATADGDPSAPLVADNLNLQSPPPRQCVRELTLGSERQRIDRALNASDERSGHRGNPPSRLGVRAPSRTRRRGTSAPTR